MKLRIMSTKKIKSIVPSKISHSVEDWSKKATWYGVTTLVITHALEL